MFSSFPLPPNPPGGSQAREIITQACIPGCLATSQQPAWEHRSLSNACDWVPVPLVFLPWLNARMLVCSVAHSGDTVIISQALTNCPILLLHLGPSEEKVAIQKNIFKCILCVCVYVCV